MPRTPLLLAVALAALAGCSTTRSVDATSVADLASVQSRVQGRRADITLASGDLYRGSIVFLRADSTAWVEDTLVLAVPTADVSLLVVDNRWRSVGRGALIGTGVGFGLGFLLGAGLASSLGGDGSEILTGGTVIGLVCAPGGAFYGIMGGAAVGRRTEYVFGNPGGEAASDGPAGGAE